MKYVGHTQERKDKYEWTMTEYGIESTKVVRDHTVFHGAINGDFGDGYVDIVWYADEMKRTQLVVGHKTLCGCPVVEVNESGFTIRHAAGCTIKLEGDEHIQAYKGQAVCSGLDTVAVLRLDLPYPHQMEGWGQRGYN